MCDMTPSHVWHDSFTCVTWLLHMCDMTPSHMWHDSFTCVTWHFFTCSKSSSSTDDMTSFTSSSTACEKDVTSHIWTRHITHINESCHSNDWVMSHVQMSHVTHMIESCPTYEWVMSLVWLSHVPRTNESCHTHESATSLTCSNTACGKWVTSHIWTRTNESRPTYEYVTSHMRMSHDICMSESRHTYEWVASLTSCNTASRKWVTSHTWTRDVTNMHESRHMYECAMSNMFDMAHSYMWRESSHVWHGVYVIRHTRHVTRDSENESRHTHEHVTSEICMSHVTCMNAPCHTSYASRHTYECVTSHI